MPNLSDEAYQKHLMDVSGMISELARNLDDYVQDETNPVVKEANRALVSRAEEMASNIDDVIVQLGIKKRTM